MFLSPVPSLLRDTNQLCWTSDVCRLLRRAAAVRNVRRSVKHSTLVHPRQRSASTSVDDYRDRIRQIPVAAAHQVAEEAADLFDRDAAAGDRRDGQTRAAERQGDTPGAVG